MFTSVLGALAALSCVLMLWQWRVARGFPLHALPSSADSLPLPGVTLLKPLKGCDIETARCLRSWLDQQYSGPVQVLFGVASAQDPVCKVVRGLIEEYPKLQAELVICAEQLGPNAKVSTLVHLQGRAVHEVLVISDADVLASPHLLRAVIAPLRDEKVGLVNCFYQLANPSNAAMRWEAVAINADFWSQVLQSQSLKPLDFALGAVMATRRLNLQHIGGFEVLLEYLADDYQLGHKIAKAGGAIRLSPVVVQCWSGPMNWQSVWNHQLRWARTIRVCQPVPFFFSILSNGTLWPLVWMIASRTWLAAVLGALFCLVRILTARSNQRRLTQARIPWNEAWLVPHKDLAGAVIWALAFLGNRIEWRGERYAMLKDGRLRPVNDS